MHCLRLTRPDQPVVSQQTDIFMLVFVRDHNLTAVWNQVLGILNDINAVGYNKKEHDPMFLLLTCKPKEFLSTVKESPSMPKSLSDRSSIELNDLWYEGSKAARSEKHTGRPKPTVHNFY